MRCAQALSGQLLAFERHEIVAARKEYGGIVMQERSDVGHTSEGLAKLPHPLAHARGSESA
jgi:hypothetical protein